MFCCNKCLLFEHERIEITAVFLPEIREAPVGRWNFESRSNTTFDAVFKLFPCFCGNLAGLFFLIHDCQSRLRQFKKHKKILVNLSITHKSETIGTMVLAFWSNIFCKIGILVLNCGFNEQIIKNQRDVKKTINFYF